MREVHSCRRSAWAQYLNTNSSAFPVRMLRINISTSWLQGAVGFRFQGRYKESNTLFQLNKSLVLIVLCCVRCKRQKRKCLLICFISEFNYTLYIQFYSLARQVLVQSSSSSRACSKRVANQTMFDVPDPLVVHVLLLTHEFLYNNICLHHSWYPHCDSFFYVPKTHRWFPLFEMMRSVGSGRCLIVY